MEAACWRFIPDPLLLEYLRDPVVRRRMRFSEDIHEGIDPYSCRPEQLQNVSEKGSYYYHANQPGPNRQTADRSGHWKAKDKQQLKDKNGHTLGYKRKSTFYLGRNGSKSTKWAMMEYTLPPDGSHDARGAICMIYMAGGNQRNEIRQASNSDATNQPLP